MFGRRGKKLKLTKAEALDAKPLRNMQVKSTTEEGLVVLEVPRRRDWVGKLLGNIFAVPLSKKVSLDEIGSFVWQLCDGEHTVRDIGTSLAKEYKLNQREAIMSLSVFLRNLGKRGLIGFAVSKETSGEVEAVGENPAKG